MTLAQALLVLKALMTVVPWVVQAVRDGHIKTAAQDEVLAALKVKIAARVDRAKLERDKDDSDPYAK